MDHAQNVYAKRDELVKAINEAKAAGSEVKANMAALLGIGVSDTAKSAPVAKAPAVPPADDAEKPAPKGIFSSKKGSE